MDKTTFEALYREMVPGLYRLAQGMLRHPADAQDAVQQAAVKAYLAADRIRPGGERAYFARVVINECRNIQRQRMRTLPVAEPPARESREPDSELKLAIEGLPLELRLPLLMKYMEGYSEKEVAAALDLSVPAVKSRLFRARRALRQALKEEVALA
ncbi:MAG: sigma-70 family RNA polymerase sigma factor [Clostridia bacterium]|nr:sigma-70 family RNA polymerase sigma factor [Clostridia bacterium]